VRITFSTEEAAQAALDIWERHGLGATRSGAVVVTTCPALWAIPIIHRTIGFHQVERLVVVDSPMAAERALPEEPTAPGTEQLRDQIAPVKNARANTIRGIHDQGGRGQEVPSIE